MNLGGPEILVIIVIALLVLGPDKLPSALRTFGRVMGEVKKYQELAKREIEKAMKESDAQESSKENKSKKHSSEQDENIDIPEDTHIDNVNSNKRDSNQQDARSAIAPIVDEDE